MRLVLPRIAVSFTAVGALTALCLGALAADAPLKERRLALVIGNAAYPFAPLRNSLNDARDFAAALKDSGFDVTILENAKLRDTRNALRDFGDRLKAQGGVGLFYYAGHGMQVKGRNYLIPVAAQIEREDEVEFESLDANQVLEKLDSAGNRFNIVILDACRNNPFARAFRSSTQGLAQMDAPSGAVVAFATSPGSVASDGAGRNGLYTQYLIENVQRPGLKIEEVFKQVRASVRRDSNGMQTPWESTSLEGDFYFHPVDRAALDAARKQQEQARIEEAVRVAIVQERERARKEFEQARLDGTAGTSTATVALIKMDSEPAAAASTPLATAAMAPATTPPAAPVNTTVAMAKPLDKTPTSGDPVIGTPNRGKLAVPTLDVDDEWEFLSITTTSALHSPQPTPVYARVRLETFLGVTGGREAMLSSVRIDKPGGKAVDPLDFYKVPYGTDDYSFKIFDVEGLQKLRFPLEPGSNWSSSNTFGSRDGSYVRNEYEYRALAWEQVNVLAGRFWALKIEVGGWRYNLSSVIQGQRQPQRIEGTIWYSPDVKYNVKSNYRVGLLTVTSTQLVSSSYITATSQGITAVVK
jgi:Caspase domain